MELLLQKPLCEDEADKMYKTAIALARPYDLGTIADTYVYWSMCKRKLWLYFNSSRRVEDCLIDTNIILNHQYINYR